MSVLLLILGIVVAASGVGAIGFGIPLNEFTLGTTLMSSGATALTGGFVLIGLSAVLSELARLADGLKRVAARAPQRPGEVLEAEVPAREVRPVAPYQPSPSSVEVSAAAIERLRSTIPRTDAPRVEPPAAGYGEEAPLSPNGATAG